VYQPTDGILLLQDVGDLSLRAAADGAAEPRVLELYREAVDQLVRIQVLGTRHADAECMAFQQRFDRRLFVWEFDHFLEYGLPAETAADHGKLRDLFDPVIEGLVTAPPVLAHRDFHGWNLYVHDGAVWVIDFQDALLAPPTYDLASLLTDRDTATVITPAVEDALIEYFLQVRQSLGAPKEDASRVRTQYFLSVLQRALKVIGRFHYLARVKEKPAYLSYLPSVAGQARRALEAMPELTRLKEALLPHLGTACAE
jgi:aminoglycoside/choline kinase family phosphotransferase